MILYIYMKKYIADRRPIDPPPIIQMISEDDDT
jgi:hypothetical protein